MRSKVLSLATRAIVVLVLALGTSALAQDPPPPAHLSGVINDYTAAMDSTGKLIGPWEVRGDWSLRINRHSDSADFSAALSMEYSDYWLANSPGASLSDPSSRSQHTHHSTMTGASISSDISVCPASNPATTTGFVLTGMADVTGNGKPAPFEGSDPNNPILSPLQVCVTGGSTIPYSNITLVFSKPASGHFGSQAIHGAVVTPRGFDYRD